jgi:hypothetical protein
MTLIPAPRGSFPPGPRGKLCACRAHASALGDVRGNRALLVERRNRLRKLGVVAGQLSAVRKPFLAGLLPGRLRLPPTYKGPVAAHADLGTRSGGESAAAVRAAGTARTTSGSGNSSVGAHAPGEHGERRDQAGRQGASHEEEVFLSRFERAPGTHPLDAALARAWCAKVGIDLSFLVVTHGAVAGAVVVSAVHDHRVI